MAFPEEIVQEISWHLDRFAEPGERGFVFVGPKGGKLRRSNFHKSVWMKARLSVGMPELHFHDLRHTGGTLSAATGATLKELMARLGHSSVRAAMSAPVAHMGHAEQLGVSVRCGPLTRKEP